MNEYKVEFLVPVNLIVKAEDHEKAVIEARKQMMFHNKTEIIVKSSEKIPHVSKKLNKLEV